MATLKIDMTAVKDRIAQAQSAVSAMQLLSDAGAISGVFNVDAKALAKWACEPIRTQS